MLDRSYCLSVITFIEDCLGNDKNLFHFENECWLFLT